MPIGGEALAALLHNPPNGTRTFLQTHFVRTIVDLAGRPNGAVERTIIYSPPVSFAGPGGAASFEIHAENVDAPLGSGPFPFFPIGLCVTFPDGELNLLQLPGVTLPPHGGGPQILVTPTLTGCCLIYQRRSAEYQCGPFLLHMQPNPGESREGLQQRLRAANPRFAGGHDQPVGLYGGEEYPGTQSANALAVRGDAGWTLLVQRYSTFPARQILDVDVIPLY
jgi:hypothetical protein